MNDWVGVVLIPWLTFGFVAGSFLGAFLHELLKKPSVEMRVFAGIALMALFPLVLVGFFVKGGHELYRVWRPLPTLPEARVV